MDRNGTLLGNAFTISPQKFFRYNQWRTEVGGLGCSTPPPEIPKALQNRVKLNPTVKTVKNC